MGSDDIRSLTADLRDELDPEPLTQAHPEALGGLEALRGVSLESVEALLERCPVRRLAPGQTLLTKGQPNNAMYFIMAGKLGIHLDEPTAPAHTFLARGDTVGELSVIDEQPVSCHVVASEPTVLLEVDQITFWGLVSASHRFTVNLLLKLSQRLRANNSSVVENSRLREQFEKAALFDALTGLRNRRWLDQMLPRFVERSLRGGTALSVLVTDIDHFKRYNDNFGHQAGDLVLGIVARVLVDGLRPTDHVARYGGEEYVVILSETDLFGARAVADRLREKVARTPFTKDDGTPLPSVTISVGCAQAIPGQSARSLFETADRALYRAKENGRNRVETETGSP